jgi:RNA polymerase sigma factor (sigma-70 family)
LAISFSARFSSADRALVVERFLALAPSIAARYRRPGEPFDDVFQVACLGLLNAIDRYDATRDQAFSSFATPTIAGEIKRYYRDRTWSVHVPRDLQDLTIAVDRARGELETELSRSPTVAEVARRLGADGEGMLTRRERLDSGMALSWRSGTRVTQSSRSSNRGCDGACQRSPRASERSDAPAPADDRTIPCLSRSRR